MPSFDLSYTYDGLGNRLSRTDHLTSEVTSYFYDSANRLETETVGSDVTTYSYDAAGNRTRKDAPASLTDYTWDAKNRLMKVELPSEDVDFQYNALGQRVQKKTASETKNFIYDFEHLLQETDASDESTRLYTFTEEGPDGSPYGDLISEYGDGEGSSFHMYDAQWSTDALVDEMDTVTDRYKFTAFGVQNQHTGMSNSPFTFVGKQAYYDDPELELYYLGSGNRRGAGRSYDAQTGRFISQDPLGFLAGDENLYRYVKNNPVNAIDPSGHVMTCPGANDCNASDGNLVNVSKQPDGDIYVRINRPGCTNANSIVGPIGKRIPETGEIKFVDPPPYLGEFKGCRGCANDSDVWSWMSEFSSTQTGSSSGPFCQVGTKKDTVLLYLIYKCNGIMMNPEQREETVLNAFLEEIGSELRERACAAIDFALPGFCDTIERIGEKCGSAISDFQELAKVGLTVGASTIIDAANAIGTGLTSALTRIIQPEELWDALSTGLSEIFGNIPGAIQSLMKTPPDLLGIAQALGVGAGDIGGWIQDGAKVIFGEENVEKWSAYIGYATDVISKLLTNPSDALSELGDVLADIQDAFKNPMELVTTILGDVLDSVQEVIKGVVTGIISKLSGIGAVMSLLEAVASVCDVLSQFIQLIIEVINSVRSGNFDVSEKIFNFLKSVLPSVLLGLINILGGKSLLRTFRCTMQAIIRSIERFVKTIIREILCFFKRKFGSEDGGGPAGGEGST